MSDCKGINVKECLSTFKFSVRTYDGQVGKIQAGMVFGAVTHLKPTDIQFANALERHLQFCAAGIGSSPPQTFNEYLGRSKSFEHRG